MQNIGAIVGSLMPLGIRSEPGVCDTHGPFTSLVRGDMTPRCPQCLMIGAARDVSTEAQARRVAHLHDISGIPSRFSEAGLKNFDVDSEEKRRARATVRSYLDRFSLAWAPLLISGPVGTGKTHLACALANNLIEQGVSARYLTMSGLLADIKRAYSTDGMTEASQIARYTDFIDLLIIDEADVIRGTDNDLGLVFSVVNGRYNNMRPVVTISNQPAAELAGFLGERTVSRLAENATTVVCNWKDRRAAA